MRPRHVILASIGTDGDIIPYVGLGVALRRRGHEATLLASDDYRELAESNGLGFRSLATTEENERCFGDPDFWHPLKGPIVGARWGVGLLERHYALFAELARDERAVFVANPGLVAARVVQDLTGRPLATVILQPWMVRSSIEPPVMPGRLTLPRWAPRPVGNLYWRLIDITGLLLMGRELNALRKRVGLLPVRKVFSWWVSPELVIGMFPAWYGPPQADWAPQVRLTGFPMSDSGVRASPPPELPADLAAFCDAPGGPPVAFTFGTGMRHAASLFAAGAEACRRLGVRAIFLTKFPAQLPSPLPPHVRHVPFAPFSRLFPRCAAVVHHGGIGTVAKSFAAGVPQLALPIAFDQTDNAIRIKRLGAGDWLPARRVTPDRIASALRPLLTGEARARSAAIARRFDPAADALDAAAALVEGLALPHG